jgi:hypothetical protein
MKQKVYAYYKTILDMPQGEEAAKIAIWRESWERYGWEPVVLNQSHVPTTPICHAIMGRVLGLRQYNPGLSALAIDLMLARCARWCALASMGGGWMSDYDVLNIGLTPDVAEDLEKRSPLIRPQDEPAYIIFANGQASLQALHELVQGPIFNPPLWDRLVPESDVLSFGKMYTELIGKLRHVHGTPREPLSQTMAVAWKEHTTEKPNSKYHPRSMRRYSKHSKALKKAHAAKRKAAWAQIKANRAAGK